MTAATEIEALLAPIRRLHEQIRDTVLDACERSAIEALAAVDRETRDDTIYALDRIGETELVALIEPEIASREPVVLIVEGLGERVLPRGTRAEDAAWRLIVDPIDGTRGLMYQKRSAWILTGVAPNRGPATRLGDIELAVQTEIPLVKQHLCDVLWARRGAGARAERLDRLRGERHPLPLRPSQADTIAHGFAQIARFFPGGRAELAAIDEAIVHGALGALPPGRAVLFEDQYVSTAGQLYELSVGHDRFTADLRPFVPGAICSHPYDLCTELIAREAGVIVVDPGGRPLAAPLDVGTDVAWAGYANAQIRRQIEPLLQQALRERGWLE